MFLSLFFFNYTCFWFIFLFCGKSIRQASSGWARNMKLMTSFVTLAHSSLCTRETSARSTPRTGELNVSAVKFTRGQLCCFGEKIWPQSLPADLAKMLEGSRSAISQILCNKRNTIWFENFSLKLSLQKKQTNNNKTQPLMTRFGKSFLLFWISCYKRNI